ncbi:uncharacterized protein LOC100159913 isoform X1 [Acyrthosiphon pisum]|uniref:ACYPI001252 protein n=1 Tax=Acyrthosiphon pisum TaxID=7029 RepID=C4WXJ1_ACYPI|nr:uncharacterized protein LOC100159913 precursor [Acyrthosiphon pisum]XP_016662606.1 uncharacterized protein LOC100159913 isoform X1 [Acyrthosiphon pisum]BAH72611.1 ACYPI001252 [Acyrthosiphon pisum]|eukprot:NP_001155417.1 uncharacterized protein LOC100159913 precursor [Acyrthosiphon pisum]
MKLTAAVTFSQICALYVLLGCSPASTAPFIIGAMQTTIKPYSEYNKIIPFKYHDVHEPRETLDERIEENVSAKTSDTTTVIGIINDDNTAIDYGYSRSKQKDFKYDQFQSFLEALTSANSKFKAMSVTTEQPFGEELTTNSFNDLVITEMLQMEHPKTFNKTKWLYPRAELAITLLNTSYIVINSTTTMLPTPYTTLPNVTTTMRPPTKPTTTAIPTTAYTTTQMPISTTTQRPKPNKFTCTLCVIIIVNE